MAEILVKARDYTDPDPEVDKASYKRGHMVVVKPDGHPWGLEERLPKFVLLKFPGVSVAAVQKYVQEHRVSTLIGERVVETLQGRRVWRLRWVDLPAAARNKLANTGELVIKVGDYAGPFDYTWTQVKQYFRNHATGTNETTEL